MSGEVAIEPGSAKRPVPATTSSGGSGLCTGGDVRNEDVSNADGLTGHPPRPLACQVRPGDAYSQISRSDTDSISGSSQTTEPSSMCPPIWHRTSPRTFTSAWTRPCYLGVGRAYASYIG